MDERRPLLGERDEPATAVGVVGPALDQVLPGQRVEDGR
jgi:hypothetical protein